MKPTHYPTMLALIAGGAAAADPAYLADWRERMLPLTPRGYICQQTLKPVQIDGKLDDEAWASAAWTEEFVDIEGPAKPKPRFRTRAKMLWDAEFFYVAADLEEPHVWGTLTQHDAVIFADPDFEVFIDPDGDTHAYYEFELNALNTGWDLFLPKPYKDGGSARNEWEIPGLKTAVHVRGTLNNPNDRDDGWSVELAFPWKVLAEHAHRPAPPHEGDQWRIGFSRVEWQIEIRDGKYSKVPKTPENNWIWSPQGVIDMHRPEKWGYVQFTKKTPGSVTFRPDPAAPAREALQEVYYAQKEFFKKHTRWAGSFDELGLVVAARSPVARPVLRLTPEGYECSTELTRPDGSIQRWVIHEDARVHSTD
jgi:Carbohydrate family 9 binding domain-like